MKNKKFTKRTGKITALLSFVVFLIVFSNVSAVEQGSVLSLSEDLEVSISEDAPEKKIAIKEMPNTPYDIYMDTEQEIKVSDGSPVTIDNESSPYMYPRDQIGISSNTYTDNEIIDPWDWVRLIDFSNSTEFEDETKNASVWANILNLGNLGVGEREEFRLPDSQYKTCVLGIDLSPGVYNLITHYYESQNTNMRIITPSNKMLSPSDIGTPSTYANGLPYYGHLFSTTEQGLHKVMMYRDTSALKNIEMELLKVPESSFSLGEFHKIKDGEAESYVAQNVENIQPKDLPIDAFTFDVKKGKEYELDVLDIWGGSRVILFYPSSSGGHQMITVNDGVSTNSILGERDGKAFLVVYRSRFLYQRIWNNRYLEYKVEEQDPINIEIGKEQTIPIEPMTTKYLKLSIDKPTALIMKEDSISTSGSSINYGNYYKYSENAMIEEQNMFTCPPGSGFELFLFDSGDYYAWVENTDENDPGTYKIFTELVPIEEDELNTIEKSWDTDIFYDDLTSLEFEHFPNASTGGQYYPKIVPYSFSNPDFGYYGYNLTWNRADNDGVLQGNGTEFDVKYKFIQKSILNQSTIFSSEISMGTLTWNNNVLGDSSTDNSTSQSEDLVYKFSNASGWLVIQPSDVLVENGTDDYYSNDTFTLRASIVDSTPMVKTETFSTEDLNGEYIDLNEVSFAEDPYNQTSIYTKFEVNATRYNVLNLKINGTQAIDYYKMILRANNTGSYSTMVISPNNPWLDDSGMNTWPYVGGNIDGSGTGNFNGTTEFFSAMREFYISIHIDSEIDSNYDTEFYVELHNSNIPILTVGDLSEVKGGLNMTLVLGLSLGIGIPVLLGAGYWFWKKR